MRELRLTFEEVRIVQIVAQIARARVELVFVDEREKLAHHLPVIAPARDDDKLFSLAADLRAIAITNAPAASQRAHRLRFDSFKVVDNELFAITKQQMQERREQTLPAQRHAVEDDSIRQREYGNKDPGNGDEQQRERVVLRAQ